jgi:type IV secretory pathway TraG/TraD family ATPase VirD4
LVAWLSNPAEIDQRVRGTEMEAMIAKGAQQQRNGVLASLGLVADSLRMLPTREQAGGKTWSATEWAETRAGWIFITSSATEREALRPLHSIWIDLLVMRLLTAPQQNQTPVWFVLDELASLQRLPQLHTAITENRKSRNPLVLGFQGKDQLEVIYGHLAEVMLSQAATKIFLKTTEPKAAEWVSNAIGKVEIERMKETHFDGSRSGRNFSLDRQIEPLVMDSEISGLENRHAFLKLGNNVARFHFEYMDLPLTTPGFIPRRGDEDELPFDPQTRAPKNYESQAPEIDLEAEQPSAAMLARLEPEEDDAEAAYLQLDVAIVSEFLRGVVVDSGQTGKVAGLHRVCRYAQDCVPRTAVAVGLVEIEVEEDILLQVRNQYRTTNGKAVVVVALKATLFLLPVKL